MCTNETITKVFKNCLKKMKVIIIALRWHVIFQHELIYLVNLFILQPLSVDLHEGDITLLTIPLFTKKFDQLSSLNFVSKRNFCFPFWLIFNYSFRNCKLFVVMWYIKHRFKKIIQFTTCLLLQAKILLELMCLPWINSRNLLFLSTILKKDSSIPRFISVHVSCILVIFMS